MKNDVPTPELPLSANCLPLASIERLKDAVVLPMEEDRSLPCGVYRNDGSFCEQSRTLLSGQRFTGVPTLPPDKDVQGIEGRYLFVGIGRHHFGHFLMEGIGRLWAMEHVHREIDGLMIVPMHGMDIETIIQRRLLPFYNLLGYDRPLHLVEHPTRVGELLIPSQAFGHLNWCMGTPEFRQFIRARIADWVVPRGPEKLYISRAKLKRTGQMLDQELQVEQMMTDAGFTIFHPQNHSISIQCQRYMAARVIVGSDGSAFHLASFAMRPQTRVGLIKRRWRHQIYDAVAEQITAFADADLTRMNPLLTTKDNVAVSGPDGLPAPINLETLRQMLKSFGFI